MHLLILLQLVSRLLTDVIFERLISDLHIWLFVQFDNLCSLRPNLHLTLSRLLATHLLFHTFFFGPVNLLSLLLELVRDSATI